MTEKQKARNHEEVTKSKENSFYWIGDFPRTLRKPAMWRFGHNYRAIFIFKADWFGYAMTLALFAWNRNILISCRHDDSRFQK